MANSQSQIKRNRQNERRRVRNKAVRTHLRTVKKRVLEAVEAGDAGAAQEAYREAAREFDRAASRGVIHANKAANNKSRLARRVAAIGGD